MASTEDTVRWRTAMLQKHAVNPWPLFISIMAVVLTILGLSGGAIYKASATEKQVDINTKELTEIKKYGERITSIEKDVEHIRAEQTEIKESQDEIKDDTRDILIELRSMQRRPPTGSTP